MPDDYDYSFSNWRRPHMARGVAKMGKHVIVVSYDLPKKHIADEIVREEWPWWIEWPALAFGNSWFTNWPRRYVRGAKVERDMIVMAAGKTFVSPATWDWLQQKRKEKVK